MELRDEMFSIFGFTSYTGVRWKVWLSADFGHFNNQDSYSFRIWKEPVYY